MTKHVVVIGAGIIGTMCAIHALDAGYQVTLIEPGNPGESHASSYGNAGWLSSHSVLPPAAPGIWKQVPHWLLDPLGPLAIRLSYLPRALPWLASYLAAAWTYPKIRRTARTLRSLLENAAPMHKALAKRAGVGELIEQRGLLHVFLDQQHFELDREAWNIRREQGVKWQTLDRAALQTLEPDLDPRYTFGILVPETGSCRNPGEYLSALVAYAQVQGARLVSGQATGFKFDELSRSVLLGVQTDTGHIACTHAIIAAGSRAKRLAALAGDQVPLETERGYHAVLKSVTAGPRVPTMFADCKVIVSSMDGGIRVAGQVEIADNDDTPNWRRAEILRQHLLKLYPKLPQDLTPDQIEIWMGRRPSTPDGIPCIGRATSCKNIIHAYGHGHIGLVSSAKTGRLVSQLLDNRVPDIDMRPFNPQRFKR